MISRRLARIKTLQALYAASQGSANARNELQDALFRTYDAYIFLLSFPHHLNEYLISAREVEIKKFFPDKTIVRKCGLLENNKLAASIYDKTIPAKRRLFSVNWSELAEQFNTLTDLLFEEEFAQDYLIFDQPDFNQQKAFLDDLYNWLFDSSEYFNNMMEDVYPAWPDDEATLLREILKTVNGATESGFVPFAAPLGYQHEEVQMALKIFDDVISNGDEYVEKISGFTENWDPGRIAVIDLLCIKMAVAEFLRFPQVPVKVSINEYLEIVKHYSTPSSSKFLNGVLDKLRISMESKGEIQKAGRGLRDK